MNYHDILAEDGEPMLGYYDLTSGAAYDVAKTLSSNWSDALLDGQKITDVITDVVEVEYQLHMWEDRIRAVYLGETKLGIAVRRAVRLQNDLNSACQIVSFLAGLKEDDWLFEDLAAIVNILGGSEDTQTAELLDTVLSGRV